LLGHSSLSTTNDNYKDVFYLIDWGTLLQRFLTHQLGER
jgi:hypothetical protein